MSRVIKSFTLPRLSIAILAMAVVAMVAMVPALTRASVDGVSGVVLISQPASVEDEQETDSNLLIVFDERQGVSLNAGLDVDIASPGTYLTGGASLPSGGVHLNGPLTVNSHFVHALDGHSSPFSGSVSFTDEEVVGLIVKSASLENTDSNLGFEGAGTVYETDSARDLEGHDSITLSNDKKTVSFTLKTFGQVDDIRIITVAASQAPPDADNDGVADNNADLCLGTATNASVDANGCSDAQVDGDGDGICDPSAPSDGPSDCTGSDNCPVDANNNQADLDNDGTGDVCDSDVDGDGVENALDNCPTDVNADQADLDIDGTGDVCDSDIDGDGVDNGPDAFPHDPNETTDSDGDHMGDNADACDSTPSGAVVNSDGCGFIKITGGGHVPTGSKDHSHSFGFNMQLGDAGWMVNFEYNDNHKGKPKDKKDALAPLQYHANALATFAGVFIDPQSGEPVGLSLTVPCEKRTLSKNDNARSNQVCHLTVVDNGEPGKGVDIFKLATDEPDGYGSGADRLSRGNIQAHYEEPDEE